LQQLDSDLLKRNAHESTNRPYFLV
jgi:hypothetical protein